MIHPTAIIHPTAQVHPSASIGPYAVIDAHVSIGPECVLGPHVYVTGRTILGARNRLHAGCVIGDAPQDLKYRDEPTGVRIGDDNVFREHVTIHRSNKVAEQTVLGSHNLLMAHSHIGHNSVLGDRVILANGTLLGGHVVIQDRAFVSGNCLIHQFVRVGTLSMMQGGAAVSKDLPPYTVARGDNCICGLNTIGLRRAGLTSEQRIELRRLYHALFRSGQGIRAAATAARTTFLGEPSLTMLSFIAESKRGVCADRGGAATDEG